MIKISWIVKQFFKDIIKHRRGILQYMGLMAFVIILGKGMKALGIFDWYLPSVMAIVVALAIYMWYGMKYDWDQKKLINKLKEEK
jgi:hypothetical protein